MIHYFQENLLAYSKGFTNFIVIYGIFTFIVHAFMGLAVNGDAKRLSSTRGGLFLFGPFLWGWIVFIFGLAGLAVYWAIHHSSLRSITPPDRRKTTDN